MPARAERHRGFPASTTAVACTSTRVEPRISLRVDCHAKSTVDALLLCEHCDRTIQLRPHVHHNHKNRAPSCVEVIIGRAFVVLSQ